MITLELVDLGDGSILDTVTAGADSAPAYGTGVAKDIVDARTTLLGSAAEALVSLAGWSNGYLALRLRADPPRPIAESRAPAPVQLVETGHISPA